MPRVSIVMPVYNGSKYLREALDSMSAQTFEDWEFIVINEEGSNDGSADIVKEYQSRDSRYILVQNSKRLGISASLNVGLDMARGEYIARMDADDISLPERLHEQVAFMDQNMDIGISGIKPIIFGDNVWEWKVEKDPNIIKSDLLFFSPVVHPTAIMRRSVLNQYGLRYNESFRYSEDYDFFVRAGEFTRIANIEKPLFRYRMHASNATNTDSNKGIELYNDVMQDHFNRLNIVFSREEIDLLSVHTGLKKVEGEALLADFTKLDLLLKKILIANADNKFYDMQHLSYTLHKRWVVAYEDNVRYKTDQAKKAEEIYTKSIFYHKYFYKGFYGTVQQPLVSVLMPTYNSEKYIADTIYSVLNQSFTNFEFLIVNEFGSNDDTVKIALMFNDPRIKIIQNTARLGLADSLNEGIRQAKGKYIARVDADDLYPRERFEKQVAFLEQNPDISLCGTWQYHFGNADWVHKPVSDPKDLKAQLLFTCDICHSTIMFRKDDFINNELWYDPSYLSEDYELWTRAVHRLDFATIPEVLGEYRWDGNNITAAKKNKLDDEAKGIIARTLREQLNIDISEEDKILLSGWDNPFGGIKTPAKRELINREKALLNRIWESNQKLQVYDEESLFKTLEKRWHWANGAGHFLTSKIPESLTAAAAAVPHVDPTPNRSAKVGMKKLAKKLLKPFFVPFKNRINHQFYELQKNILNTLDERIWKSELEITRVVDARIWKSELELSQRLDQRFQQNENQFIQEWDTRDFQQETKIIQQVSGRLNSLERHLDRSLEQFTQQLEGKLNEYYHKLEQTFQQRIDALEKINRNVVSRITESEQKTVQLLQKSNEALQQSNEGLIGLGHQLNKQIPRTDEKVRIVFLFQVASFWPSWESFWESCMQDDRIEVQIVVFDQDVQEYVQMKTARAFLEKNNIDYVSYHDFDLTAFKPHVLVMQTPYSDYHRPAYLWAGKLKSQGVRVIYIPYGIEITDTENAREAQFLNEVILNCWKVYVLSESIKKEYEMYSPIGASNVRALGHPKFDKLFHSERIARSNEISQAAKGRKVILWKVHFPKEIYVDGRKVMVTPKLDEYIEFAKSIKEYSEYLFVFCPHPKFDEMCQWLEEDSGKGKELRQVLKQFENVYLFEEDDYRPAVVQADYIMVDRSAVMVEAASTEKPILYLYNEDYYEPITEAVKPLIESYYQGTGSKDMINFIEMCKRGEDPKKATRLAAFRQCVPYYDGLTGQRIKDDILESLFNETK